MDFLDLKHQKTQNSESSKEGGDNVGWAPIANIVLHEDKDTFKKVLTHMQLNSSNQNGKSKIEKSK